MSCFDPCCSCGNHASCLCNPSFCNTEKVSAGFNINMGDSPSGTPLTLNEDILRCDNIISLQNGNSLFLAVSRIFEVSYTVKVTALNEGFAAITPEINSIPLQEPFSIAPVLSIAYNTVSLSGSFLVNTCEATSVLRFIYSGTQASSITGNIIVKEIDNCCLC